MYSGYFYPYMAHDGIRGQKWGRRRYQNEDGTWTELGKIRYGSDTKDHVSKTITKKMDRYAKIAGRSDKKEVKAIKKGDSMRAQFYKRQAEEATKYLESAARMLVSYSSTPERTKKANNFISLISNKPLMEIATRELFNDRESNRGDESAKRMYEIAKRGKTKFKKYGRDIV